MTDDIVARLRGFWQPNDTQSSLRDEAADEIERLRELLGNSEQLRAERDEARKLYCEKMSILSRYSICTPRWFAEEMGWDCCKEDTDDR